ncbi:MAG: hypothetical protein U0872_02700 [Planctomycetaceae bacterium]
MSVLAFSPRITCLPIIHGSGDFALEVRRLLLTRTFDCLAVPLPPSFQADVERAITFLPNVSLVIQEENRWQIRDEWTEDESSDDDRRVASYVPIDPCQGVITALRIALQERMPRAFIDLETADFQVVTGVFPDPYALKQVSPEQFAAAVLPGVPALPDGQPRHRALTMAARLRRLEEQHESILFICSLLDWPWIRDVYHQQVTPAVDDDEIAETEIYAAEPRQLLFLLGELPFLTGLYEQARAELEQDENLSVDGVKSLLLAARSRYQQEFGKRARNISPKLLQTYIQYVRNLSLIGHRLTPDLYSLIVAAQQIIGDQFAIAVAEAVREYPFTGQLPFPTMSLGIGKGLLPEGDVVALKNRLPGQTISWKTCRLVPQPPKIDQLKWQMRWNPYHQCSWPPEDIAIEKFRTHVKDTALSLLGNDLARTEKFTTSLKDGLDIRESLRNWHTGQLYVKELPPTRGSLDCVVMLFDSPADPRDYPWRVTWHAEHHDESTLALFATNFQENMVGPGIGQATYGGALFLFPPRPVPDVWRNKRFDFVDTLEERLLAAGCFHAAERHVAVLSLAPPGPVFRRIAKRYGKKLVHVPLSRFSQQMIQHDRMFHVLNGTHIRSFASHFIRKA